MHSRTLLVVSTILLCESSTAWAQRDTRAQINGTIGTRFGGRLSVDLEDGDGVEIDSGTLTTDSSMAWGALFSYQIQQNGNVFLSYSRQETTFRLRSVNGTEEQWSIDDLSGDGSIEYFQLGGNLQALTQYLIPYLGVSIGLTRVAAKDAGDWARFNLTLDGGLRFDFIPLLDLRVFSRVPFTFPATQLYCFSGRGCAIASNGNPFVQGELHAGLGLKF